MTIASPLHEPIQTSVAESRLFLPRYYLILSGRGLQLLKHVCEFPDSNARAQLIELAIHANGEGAGRSARLSCRS